MRSAADRSLRPRRSPGSFARIAFPGPSSPPDGSALRLVFGQSGLGPGQVIVAGPVRSRGQVDVVDVRRVDPQDLLLDGRRQLGIAVPLLKGRGYVERPEGVDHRLGRPVPDSVTAPDDV